MFNQESRLVNDQCGYTLKNKESTEACNYRLTNFYTKNCNMTDIIDFATTQPSIFYNGGHQTGMNGCNIKDLISKAIINAPKIVFVFSTMIFLKFFLFIMK